MTHSHVTAVQDDEPELLRDQFRQLLRYRAIIGAGIGIGLLGGVWFGMSNADTYVATSQVVLRAPVNDPFNPSISQDKTLNMGSERQTALSSSVAEQAARKLGWTGTIGRLQKDLQVTNPPQSQVLQFTYTADTPQAAADRANAVTQAYLGLREKQWTDLRGTLLAGQQRQLDEVAKKHDQKTKELDRMPDGAARDAEYSVKTNLLNRINELDARISQLKSLDMSPGTVIRVATAPGYSDGPGLPMSLGLGALVGIALGLLAAWVRLVFDPAPRSAGDVARAVRAPVLGTLPRGATDVLLADDHTDARVAEEYRSVAFRLAYDQRFADRRRLLVVAPRGSNEAAVAVASHLAASFAETGKDVLLIEADLRDPTLKGRLRAHAAAAPRWSSPVESRENEEGGWPSRRQLSVDAGESGSFGLVPGERVRNVARALTGPRVSRLIAEADSPNSTVVVLAPPVLNYADALALVDRVDGVLVVCDPRGVHRTDLQRIRELIAGAGGTVLGAVVHTSGRRRRRAAKKQGGRRGSGGGHSYPPPPGTEEFAAEPEQILLGDGSDTVALRSLRAEDLRTGPAAGRDIRAGDR
ncbi:lipopolysaccharide biosynthesis protein [Streptomyces sp. P9(2023)]|uniref:lipopolysaccharide biosynthesis protein n=1 Tax=Streptomyces sp. P9(2023) TaxID=3064394 RepID=UPI0028F410D8|nr:lipopolysaccharide biosynthesis protein [Streptomyces sp. P9(2023)]MDT9690045.1 lipopolysaccharide biosynthesis protein [Streptomyces sp. P9(2023)]